jgi:hypothetical protein
VVPSTIYAEMFARDTFWTVAGAGSPEVLDDFVAMFARNATAPAWEPPLGGLVPTFLRKHVAAPTDGRQDDESAMFWLLGALLSGRTLATEPYIGQVYDWLRAHAPDGGYATWSHGWLDAWRPTPAKTVSANNQGLYCVALRALRQMGVAVPADEIARADAAYRSLVAGGYLHAYRGSDAVDVSGLLGEALALYLWDEPLLSDAAVTGTIAHFAPAYYRDGSFLGFKVLANADGSYLPPSDFWDVAAREPGNYENGGTWLLYDALALYAGARHDSGETYASLLVKRLEAEIKYENTSKEHMCTGGNCGGCTPSACICPDGICSAGAYGFGRAGYGWNAFVKRLVTPDRIR